MSEVKIRSFEKVQVHKRDGSIFMVLYAPWLMTEIELNDIEIDAANYLERLHELTPEERADQLNAEELTAFNSTSAAFFCWYLMEKHDFIRETTDQQAYEMTPQFWIED